MAATQQHVELDAASATAANSRASSIAATLAATAVSPDVLSSVPAAAEVMASIWVPVAAIVSDMDRDSASAVAGLAAHGIKVAERHDEAVTATVGTDEENSRALATIPTVSL